MSKSNFNGNYTKAFLSEEKLNESSMESKYYDKTIKIEKNEAVYIYSFKENKMLFSRGFDVLFNKKKEEINIVELNSFYTKNYKDFINEYHDRLLLFLYNNNTNLETFTSRLIIKAPEIESFLFMHIKVFQTDENGNLVSLITRVSKQESLRSSDVVQYGLTGDIDTDFLFKINHELDHQKRVSINEIAIIEGLEDKLSIDQISNNLSYSVLETETVLENLKKRFKLSNNEELIKFSYDNHILPNQFK